MHSCLPVNIIDAKFNFTTIFPDRTGRAYGRSGPYRPLIVTERSITISSTFYDTCQALAGLQERFAGPAPRGESQRVPSC